MQKKHGTLSCRYMVRGHETLRAIACVTLAEHDVVCQGLTNSARLLF